MQVVTAGLPKVNFQAFEAAFMSWAPTGQHILLNNVSQGWLTLLDITTSTSKFLDLADYTYGVSSTVAFALDYCTAAVLMTDTIGVIDVASWRLLNKHRLWTSNTARTRESYDGNMHPEAIGFAPHGRTLYSWIRNGRWSGSLRREWFFGSLHF